MKTIKADLTSLDDKEYRSYIEKAAEIIKKGGIVAFPTETVYGLGADALNEDAVKKIFEAKGRPQDNPLIIHVAGKYIGLYAMDFDERVYTLIDNFWPGPLTVLLRKKDLVPDVTTAGLKTVGIRMPHNRVALDLIKASGVPIAAPSANISGRPSPTTYKRCIEDLDGKVDMILGYNQSEVGVESTILDASQTGTWEILRPGGILKEDLERVLKDKVQDRDFPMDDKGAPRAPGMKYTHYSPKAEVKLLYGNVNNIYQYLLNIINLEKNTRIIVYNDNGPKGREILNQMRRVAKLRQLVEISSLKEFTHDIFEILRESDDLGFNKILIQSVKEEGLGRTLMNRLKKSSGFNFVNL